MEGNPVDKDESTTSSLMELLKRYTNRVDERESLVKEAGTNDANRQLQKTQINEIEKSKDPVNKSQSRISSISDNNEQTDEEKTNINYKTKWEESELKYQQLEKKYRQLENGTIKQLEDKVDQLQRDYNQMKLIKERITEICSCRQLTNIQLEQLKFLVNNNTHLSIENIATKNDFHQQTRKLRDILLQHNEELFTKIDEIIKKKRKRSQYEDDSTDDNERN